MEVLSSFDVHLMWKLRYFILFRLAVELDPSKLILINCTGYEWLVLQVVRLLYLAVVDSAAAFLLP